MSYHHYIFLGLVIFVVQLSTTQAIGHKRQFRSTEFIGRCGVRTGLGSKAILAAAGRGVPGSCSNYTLMCLTYTRQFLSFNDECSVGLWWNTQLNTCEPPDTQSRPDCVAAVCRPPFGLPRDMPFSAPDPRSCYGVYECLPTDTGYMAFFEMCETSSFFDVMIRECRPSLRSFCTRPETSFFPCFREKGCTEPGLVWSSAYCRCVHPSLE